MAAQADAAASAVARTDGGRARKRPGWAFRTRLSVWPPLPPTAHLQRRAGCPFPLGEASCRLFVLGRHALRVGVQALGVTSGDEILVPAYHHGSEVEALAELGLTRRFYAGRDTLEPDADELDALRTPRTRALLLIHYLGFPQRARHWRRWCDDRGLFLVEDAAQAWLATSEGEPVGSHGDVAIYCLYKSVGVPSGAALVSRVPTVRAPAGPSGGWSTVARRHAAWLASRIALPRRDRIGALSPASAGDDFAADVAGDIVGPAAGTARFGARLAADVAARRRANYERLLALLRGRTSAPFEAVPAGASPFVFPLDTGDKRRVLAALRAADIHAFDFWSFAHPSLDEHAFPAVRRRRDRTVGLPVHQELRPRDLDRIAAVVAAAAGAEQ